MGTIEKNLFKCDKEVTLTVLNNKFSISDFDRKELEKELRNAIEKKQDWNSDEYWEFVQEQGTIVARDELNWIFGTKFFVKKKKK